MLWLLPRVRRSVFQIAFGGLFLLAWLSHRFPAGAQLPVPEGANLFTDETVSKSPGEVSGYPQTLIFQDGRQFRGELVSLDDSEVHWRRPDLQAELRFARPSVRGIISTRSLVDASTKVRATVKLAGADWLVGDLTSNDGESFHLAFRGGASTTLKRTQIEWLYFDVQPMTAAGFAGSVADLDGWLDLTRSTGRQIADGVITLRKGEALVHRLPMVPRFEIAFELPRAAEKGTRLFLQRSPEIGPIATTETVTLELGRKPYIRGVIGDVDDQNSDDSPLPPEKEGPVSYRLLYNYEANRVMVVRDGRLEGDWQIRRTLAATGVQSFCFDRPDRSLQFLSLRVRPWAGEQPKSGEEAKTDRISDKEGKALAGKLEGVNGESLTIAGATRPLESGEFMEMANRPPRLADAESRLLLRDGGELSVAGVRIEKGRLHCRESFSPNLDLPLESVESISLREAAPVADSADIAVFKDGDELEGRLVRAAKGEALRWLTVAGQEIAIPSERVAGVRFGSISEASAIEPPGVLEFKNGDRLRCFFESLDAERAQLRSDRIGLAFAKRSSLWRYSKDALFVTRDGGCNPDAWSKGSSVEDPSSRNWIYLDGAFVTRTSAINSSISPAFRLQSPFPDGPSKYVVSFEVTNAAGQEPNFSLSLLGKPSDPMVGLAYNHDLQLFAADAKGGESGFIPWSEKPGDPPGRFYVQAFVNGPTGMVSFYLNGTPVTDPGNHGMDRRPGLGNRVEIRAMAINHSPEVISDICITPWNGKYPPAPETESSVLLENGDGIDGIVKSVRAGNLNIESEGRGFEIPLERLRLIEFGGAVVPKKAPVRLRLPDGSLIHADEFRCASGQVTILSETFGDLCFSVTALSEVAFEPRVLQSIHPPVVEGKER